MSETGPGSVSGALCADARTLDMLEFPQLLARIASLAQSPQGARKVRGLTPRPHLPTAARRLERLGQLKALLDENPAPDLYGLEGVEPLLDRLKVGGALLSPPELEKMAGFLAACGRAASFLDLAGEENRELFRVRNLMTPLPEVVKHLRKVVGPGGSVSSQASPALARARKELNAGRERLNGRLTELMSQSRYKGVFSDQVVTQRADRFVVPVKTDAKGRLGGIIHDASQSGATYFVEPLEVVEENNHLALLRGREREEEERVLRETAELLAKNLPVLHENLDAAAKLDCLLSQAIFCARLGAEPPELNQSGGIDLVRVRHPLLAWRALAGKSRAVPISFKLQPEHKVLIISGANAGGKTAALKTVGLVTLMAMCGLMIPCASGSRICLFERIVGEIGDEQTLEGDLSTFTAHAGRLAHMLESSGPGCLILVDELGGGTDPGEGAALGMAILEKLMAKDARVLSTTHYHRLKAFAALTEGVENVSVAFDQTSGEPTYQLHYGAPGISDALEVSSRLGFDPGVIARAREFIDGGEQQTVALLRQAQADRQAAARELEQARAEQAAARKDRQEARQLRNQARRERSGALAEGKRRVREVARRLEERLEELIGRTQQEQEQGEETLPGRVRQELYQARRNALSEVQEAVGAPGPVRAEAMASAQTLKAGQAVRVASLNQRGELLDDPRPDHDTVAVSVGLKGVRVMVPLAEIEPLTEPAPSASDPREKGISITAKADDGLDLKVVGLRVDEALPLVDKALDKALLAGRPNLRVVHGVGTGRLGAAVRQYLRGHPMVVSARADSSRPGGAGVTVAELRE